MNPEDELTEDLMEELTQAQERSGPITYHEFFRQNIPRGQLSETRIADELVIQRPLRNMTRDQINSYALQATQAAYIQTTSSFYVPITVSDVEKHLGVSATLWDTLEAQELVNSIVKLARGLL